MDDNLLDTDMSMLLIEPVNKNQEEILYYDKYITINMTQNTYYCSICAFQGRISPKTRNSNIVKHVITKNHANALKNAIEFESTPVPNKVQFEYNFVLFLAAKNIPFDRINNRSFKNLFESSCFISLKSVNYYKNYFLNDVVKSDFTEKINLLRGNEYWLMFDSTVDFRGKKMCNVLAGVLHPDKQDKPFLIKNIVLSSGSAASYECVLLECIKDIENSILHANKCRLLISDAEAACRSIKEKFPKIKHVTCMAHFVHNIIDKFISKHTHTIKFILLFYEMLGKARYKYIFDQKTQLIVPNKPIRIRWGTYLNVFQWIFVNYNQINDFFENTILVNELHFDTYRTYWIDNKSIIASEVALAQQVFPLLPIIHFLESEDIPAFTMTKKN